MNTTRKALYLIALAILLALVAAATWHFFLRQAAPYPGT